MSHTIAAFQPPPITAEQFVVRKFDSAAAKAGFGNHLLAFVAEDFPRKRFTLAFHRVLRQHFGITAHSDQHGFWSEFVTSTADKLCFLEGLPEHRPEWSSMLEYQHVQTRRYRL